MTIPRTELLTSHEAASIIGIRYHAFRKRLDRQRLPMSPVAKVGGTWLWLRSDIDAYARLESR